MTMIFEQYPYICLQLIYKVGYSTTVLNDFTFQAQGQCLCYGGVVEYPRPAFMTSSFFRAHLEKPKAYMAKQ